MKDIKYLPPPAPGVLIGPQKSGCIICINLSYPESERRKESLVYFALQQGRQGEVLTL